MNLAEIETFLTIVNTKSITRTADLLFLSQPTVSHRLTSLENELGFPLVIRQKGHKQVELTAKGTDFIILAERWMSLWKETMELQRNQDSLLLTIGCTDSLNVAVFAPLYDRILNEQTKLDLNIESHHSSELYGLLGEHSIDIGFVYHKLHYKNIITEKIFEEKLYLIQSDQPAISAPAIHTDELDPSLELFLSWDDNYQIWHDRWLSSASRPHIAADTITLLDRLWKKPGNWMVAPQSVILELSHYRPLFISELKNTPPNRVCYKIKHKYPKSTSKRAVEFFENALEDFLAESTPSFPIGQVWERQKYKNRKHKPVTGTFSALPFLLILYTRMIHPPLFATKSNNGPRLVSSYIKNPLFTRIFSISIQNNISSDCVYFLLFVTKIVIKEPRPIKGMALIITLHFQAFSFHSVLLQHLRDCICSL